MEQEKKELTKEEKEAQEAELKRQNECLEKLLAILAEYGYTMKIDNQISLIKKING